MTNTEMKSIDYKSKIDNIDFRIRKLLENEHVSDGTMQVAIDAQIGMLMREKRELYLASKKAGNESIDWQESKHLFEGLDFSQRKKQFEREARQMIHEFNDKLNKLETKMRSKKDMLNKGVRAKMQELNSQKEALQSQINEMTVASGNAWEDLKVGFEDTTEIFKRTWENASSEFSQTGKPTK